MPPPNIGEINTVAYRRFLAPGARSEIAAPFADFFPTIFKNGRLKQIEVIFKSEKQKKQKQTKTKTKIGPHQFLFSHFYVHQQRSIYIGLHDIHISLTLLNSSMFSERYWCQLVGMVGLLFFLSG